jgi:cellobiose epimerase
MEKEILLLKNELSTELENILKYWIAKTPDNENGGFYGRISGDNKLMPLCNKGSVLNARILWTFSAAYRLLGKEKYLEMAKRAKNYLAKYFYDTQFGGIYWMLDQKGNPFDTKKQIYAQAFAIYALAEFYRISQDQESLDFAINLYHLIEKHSFDKNLNGYFEAYSREWNLMEDLRLSEKDANEKKTMNTHLHVLEAYTSLYRVWPDCGLQIQLKNLVQLFLDRIIDSQTSSFKLFFDEQWNAKSSVTSFGHDIEGSWLLHEAAEVLHDEPLLETVKKISLKMAEKVAAEAIDTDGSLVYEAEHGHIVDYDRHWWPQAEAIVGFFNAWQLSGNKKFIDKALGVWNYIKHQIIDKENGEWYFRVNRDGLPYHEEDKVGPWKCPYHNGRACLEILERCRKME